MRTRWHAGRLLRVLTAPLVLAGVLTALGSAGASAATCQAWTGGQPPSPGGTAELLGVAVLTPCNTWAVGFDSSGAGSRTLIEHWTGGSTWTVVPSPSPGNSINFLTSVRAVSPTNIWAVGNYFTGPDNEKSLILHWNGVTWLQVPSPSPGGANKCC
jgi:hypothetical protein